jgi:hypothetical protein
MPKIFARPSRAECTPKVMAAPPMPPQISTPSRRSMISPRVLFSRLALGLGAIGLAAAGRGRSLGASIRVGAAALAPTGRSADLAAASIFTLADL